MGSKASLSEGTDDFFPPADDFTRIPGIGPVIQQQLYGAGILRYAQLAALTPEQIAQLITNLPLLSAERIANQNWPAQARALAAQPSLVGPGAAGRLRYATFTVELFLDHLSHVYRTRIRHLQDGDEDDWDGWDQTRMIDFFDRYAELDSAATAVASAELAYEHPASPGPSLQRRIAPAKREELWLEIGEIGLKEVQSTGDSREPPDTTRARALLDFCLNGSRARRAHVEALPFTASLLAYSLAGDQVIVLATCRDQLSTNQIDRELSFEFELPQEGRYQLVGTIVIADADVVGSVLGPVLRII